MKKRSLLALLLASLMVISAVLAGCNPATPSSAAPAPGTTEAQKSEQAPTEPAGEKTPGYVGNGGTFSFYTRSTFIEWLQDLLWYDEAEARTGVKVDYVKGSDSMKTVYSEIDQMVLSGTLTDATMCKQAQANVYGSQGAFYDLKPLIDEYAPHIKAYLEKNPNYAAVVNTDGHIYGLLGEQPNGLKSDFIMYRADHFKKAGIDPEKIVTFKDFEDALYKLKDFYKDVDNYYPLGGREDFFKLFVLFNAGRHFDDDGTCHGFYFNFFNGYDIKAEGMREYVETMKKWVDDGIVNQEWVAGTFGEGDWEGQVWEGRCSVCSDFYTRPASFNLAGKDYDPDFDMEVMDYLKDDKGNYLKYITGTTFYDQTRATVINAKASKETAITIIQFIDYFYSEEGQLLANWGVEGKSFKYVDGKPEFIVSYDEELAKPDGTKEWSFLSDRYTVCKPVDSDAFFKFNNEKIAEAASKIFNEDHLEYCPNIIYTDAQNEELSQIMASLKETSNARLADFMLGRTEINDANWEQYLKDMDGLGYSRMEELVTAAYKATYNK